MKKLKTFFIKTFGCAMNEAESEKLAAHYLQKGYQKAISLEKASLVIINSCSIREAAENRVFGLVNKLAKLKPRPQIILTGCMVGSALGQRRRYTLRQLQLRLPQVDQFIPWWDWPFAKLDSSKTRRFRRQALLPIMKGCNHFCTYCVVPYAKEKEFSLPFNDLICQAQKLAEDGVTRLTLLGQNVNSYGLDFSPKQKTALFKQYHDLSASPSGGNYDPDARGSNLSLFTLLLRTLHQIKGLKKISFLTSNPWNFPDELISALALPKIDRYLHLPLQSGDNRVLKKMNRPYTRQEYLRLVKKLRQAVPDLQIGTDIIVGFPGETEKAFQNTLSLCQKVGFTKAYLSLYSVRPGTAAARLKDNVPHPEKKRRWQVLENLINKKSTSK